MQNVGNDLGNSQPVWDGTGEYVAFPNGTNVGGGGYVAPVQPNPTLVPPTYVADSYNGLKIYLLSNGDVANFSEDGKGVGYGQSAVVSYPNILTYGNNKTYKAGIDNQITKNYYLVSIQKKYNTNYTFTNEYGQTSYNNYNNYNYNTNPYGFSYVQQPYQTQQDFLYAENINVDEYTYDEASQSYVLSNTKVLDKTSGTIQLSFDFLPAKPNIKPIEDGTPQTTPTDSLVPYNISFASNLKSELGDILSLHYDIVSSNTDILESGDITLSHGSLDASSILKSKLQNGNVNFKIKGTLPDGYSYTNIYWANSIIANANQSDFTKWNSTNDSFSISGNDLLNGIVVVALLERVIVAPVPHITLQSISYDVNVKDSDTEKSISIPFNTTNSDYVLVYVSADNVIRLNTTESAATLYFKKDFNRIFGKKKIYLVAESTAYGTGDKVEVILNFNAVNDFPSITEIITGDKIDVPSFSDLNIDIPVTYNAINATSVDVDLLAKDMSTIIPLMRGLSTQGSFNINLRDLATTYSNWNGSDNITLILTPYNRGGATELKGNTYQTITKINYPTIRLDEDKIQKSLFDAFQQHLGFTEPEKESKYLTHLINFGDNDQNLISSWEEDNWTLSEKSQDELGNTIVTKEVQSLILKLYNPLPAGVVNNTTLWVTKLMTNPLIETVILNQQDNLHCPPIKGPNFNIDVDYVRGSSTSYESLDSLILSASVSSSSQLVQQYLSSSNVNTSELNIEYTDGSNYLWDNFVHFSSAKERVDNFVYKVQLIEVYEGLISASYYDPLGYSYTGSFSSQQERERQNIKKNQIIQSFDGFENFLYTSSSMSWPYSGSVRITSTDNRVKNWYVTSSIDAEDYDVQNMNWVQNNIPQYIVSNEENASLLLFFSMVGQHFDTIYYYTKAIEKSRGLGYKGTGGISDKLLFDTLKSFNWDAKNIAADKQLWNLVFGMDSNGNVKETNPAKQRNYEIWRRLVNNLPYLLKHKGTRKGIYALMACYGIPSSNLSILEFGGPEVSDTNVNKLIMDNITTALTFQNNSRLDIPWNNTEQNRKPDTIELFVKAPISGQYNLISGSYFSVSLSGSAYSDYGVVGFNINGLPLQSDPIKIFNGNFFGLEISRVSGSVTTYNLNIRQAQKERTIFEWTGSLNGNFNAWESGSTISLGNNFTGSVDEFRLWSTPLNVDSFFTHVSFPEMVNGNDINASMDDLYFRLDFEYPKNLNQTSSLVNVANNVFYPDNYNRNYYENHTTTLGLTSTNPSPTFAATAVNFPSINSYPFQFEAIDRTIVLEVPSVGSSRYGTNKVRFESQTDTFGNNASNGIDLSATSRATIKSFDQSPADSNRVGLFFSPTKELNIDIAKSFGGINLDDYIGDPSDMYNPNYKSLDDLRSYYFQRFKGRDIYSYINLIKLYEKSMFEDIKNMLPARVKATTGLLIEPHFLERSKVAHKKPSAVNNQYETEINYSDTTNISAQNNQLQTELNAIENYIVSGENEQYNAEIFTASINNISAENYQYDSSINFNDTTMVSGELNYNEAIIETNLGKATIQSSIELSNSNQLVGQTKFEELGFNIFGESGSAIYSYYDSTGVLHKDRVKVSLVTTQKSRSFIYTTGSANTQYNVYATQSYFETDLNIQNITGSFPIVGKGGIVNVVPLDGYLNSHYKYTNNLTRGLKNSYYKGSKNTIATTIDGAPPIETFISNPNTLRVNPVGRNASEPILEVE